MIQQAKQGDNCFAGGWGTLGHCCGCLLSKQ